MDGNSEADKLASIGDTGLGASDAATENDFVRRAIADATGTTFPSAAHGQAPESPDGLQQEQFIPDYGGLANPMEPDASDSLRRSSSEPASEGEESSKWSDEDDRQSWKTMSREEQKRQLRGFNRKMVSAQRRAARVMRRRGLQPAFHLDNLSPGLREFCEARYFDSLLAIRPDGTTVLHLLVNEGRKYDTIEMCIEAIRILPMPYIDAMPPEGQLRGLTPLMIASGGRDFANGREYIIRELVGRGADMELRNLHGQTPFLICGGSAYTDGARALHELGCDVLATRPGADRGTRRNFADECAMSNKRLVQWWRELTGQRSSKAANPKEHPRYNRTGCSERRFCRNIGVEPPTRDKDDDLPAARQPKYVQPEANKPKDAAAEAAERECMSTTRWCQQQQQEEQHRQQQLIYFQQQQHHQHYHSQFAWHYQQQCVGMYNPSALGAEPHPEAVAKAQHRRAEERRKLDATMEQRWKKDEEERSILEQAGAIKERVVEKDLRAVEERRARSGSRSRRPSTELRTRKAAWPTFQEEEEMSRRVLPRRSL